jgi:hypothetical protein
MCNREEAAALGNSEEQRRYKGYRLEMETTAHHDLCMPEVGTSSSAKDYDTAAKLDWNS